jgi:two-component sensor histidine kinase
MIGLVNISKDITARKSAEVHRRFLMEELSHRVKNTIVIIHALARQSFKESAVDAAIWTGFEARLLAMAMAHDILTRESWMGADIGEIVSEALKIHHADRFDIAGPPAWLDAQTALALSMAFHELGTNAVKYGALSGSLGKVCIKWHVERAGDGDVLTLCWRETGGPHVTPPKRLGFGSRMIEQAFALHGSNSCCIEYRPVGIEFRVSIGLKSQPLAI